MCVACGPPFTDFAAPLRQLQALERGSGGAGARRAAEIVREVLASAGLPARVELERVHGTYWWPVGLVARLDEP